MESSVHPSVDFFLGATTPAGFKGYFAPGGLCFDYIQECEERYRTNVTESIEEK